jgi:hypothetical protein
MQAYLDEGREDLANIGDRFEQIQVDGLNRLTDSIAQAGSEYLKLGGIAGDVINGIISDLIRLAAKQAVVAVFGGAPGAASGGGLGTTIGMSRSDQPAFTAIGNFKPWSASA